MNSRNKHRRLKNEGLVYVTGWIRSEDRVRWGRMQEAARPCIAQATAIKRPRGRPRKDKSSQAAAPA